MQFIRFSWEENIFAGFIEYALGFYKENEISSSDSVTSALCTPLKCQRILLTDIRD